MNRIKELRKEKEINQDVLANLLGLEIAGISKLETGRVPLKDEYIIKLANFFDVSTDYLLCKTNIRNNIVKVSRIPILGTVKAGYNWLAEENIVDYITLKEDIPNVNEYFALRITGDSMLPLLSDGDFVIVHNQDDVESGQTAVVLINGEEATVKKVVKTSEGIELHSMNPYYPTKKFSFENMKKMPIKIIGRVREAKIKGAFD